jgi:hypothetical protein
VIKESVGVKVRNLSMIVIMVVVALMSISCFAYAGDSSYVNFTGNVTQIREVKNSSNVVIRREIWLAVLTATGVKTFQFRCAPGHPTFDGCEDQSLLIGCTTTGVGGSNDNETYSGFACSSGYGKCRELSGMADRLSNGSIIHDLNTNSSINGCSAK